MCTKSLVLLSSSKQNLHVAEGIIMKEDRTHFSTIKEKAGLISSKSGDLLRPAHVARQKTSINHIPWAQIKTIKHFPSVKWVSTPAGVEKVKEILKIDHWLSLEMAEF